jgi:pimeloyl-ACP methyl ester carboxylesterase
MRATVVAQNAAITSDPPKDGAYPASFGAFAITSHGSSMNAIAYIAAGKGPHPVVVLLHGFPGNEKNLDVAQAMRRAGYDVVQFYYRGAWGSQGAFSFANAMEDVASAVAYIRTPENAKRLRADPGDIILMGHSMGGWLALAETASDPKIRAVITISPAEMSRIGPPSGGTQARDAVIKGLAARLEEEDLAPLAGCTGESLAAELIDHHDQWSFSSYAKGIATRPAYFITSDDGLAASATALQKSLQAAGDTHAGGSHLATDHTYSDKRIALTQLVLDELARITR